MHLDTGARALVTIDELMGSKQYATIALTLINLPASLVGTTSTSLKRSDIAFKPFQVVCMMILKIRMCLNLYQLCASMRWIGVYIKSGLLWEFQSAIQNRRQVIKKAHIDNLITFQWVSCANKGKRIHYSSMFSSILCIRMRWHTHECWQVRYNRDTQKQWILRRKISAMNRIAEIDDEDVLINIWDLNRERFWIVDLRRVLNLI